MNITKRYVHPQEQPTLDAMEKAREAQGGHNFGHNGKSNAKIKRDIPSPIN